MKGAMIAALLLTSALLASCAPTETQQMDLYGTAVVSQQQVYVSGMLLTGTAQAPIVHITETSAAFAMMQVYAQSTDISAAKTATVSAEQTRSSWTPTPSATPTVNVTGTLSVEKMNAEIETSRLEVARAQTTNTMRAMSAYVVGFLALIAALMFVIVIARRIAVKPNPVDDRGNPQPMYDVVDGTAWDIGRSVNGLIGTKPKYLKQLPQVTAERQDSVTARDQLMEMRLASLPKRLVDMQAKSLPAPASAAVSDFDGLFPLPEWDMFNSWDGKGGLPYGQSARGLELMDLNLYPHVATIGKTGSGKSRRFLRPFLAGALAAGQRVVIIGKQADYWPFTSHPNATILPVRELTVLDEAKRYAYFLKMIIEEMNRRDGQLTSMRRSTWQQAGRENTLIVLDELGNAIDLMPREFAVDSYRYVRGLVKEGRKVGLNLIFSSQRAVGFRDVMTQVGRAVFFVEDEQESRHALGILGAETLRDGYFLAKFGGMKLTGAFEPSDQQIVEFLASRQVRELGRPNFIDADPQIPETKEEPRLEDDRARIEQMLGDGKSVSAIVRELYGVSGGGAYAPLAEKVKAVIQARRASSSLGMSQNGLEAAV